MPQKVTVRVENGIAKTKCPKCQEEFTQDVLKFHVMVSKTVVGSSGSTKTTYCTYKIHKNNYNVVAKHLPETFLMVYFAVRL